MMYKVSFYGIRCYLDDENGEFWGANWFCDKLVFPMCYAHNFLSFLTVCINPDFVQPGFPLKVLEVMDDEDGD